MIEILKYLNTEDTANNIFNMYLVNQKKITLSRKSVILGAIRLRARFEGDQELVIKIEKLQSDLKNSNMTERNNNKYKKIINPEDLIDVEFYKRQYWWDFEKNKINPIEHYMNHGWKEGRKPNSWFDTNFYIQKYMGGEKTQNPLIDYCKNIYQQSKSCNIDEEKYSLYFKHKAKEDQIIKFIHDQNIELSYSFNKGELREQILKAIKLEPLIAHSFKSALDFNRPHLQDSHEFKMSRDLKKIIEKLTNKKIQFLIFVPWIKMGGSDKVTAILANTIAKIIGPESILVVMTESNDEPQISYLDASIQKVGIAHAYSKGNYYWHSKFIFELIRAISPRITINISSDDFWQMLKLYGREIKSITKLSTWLFCDDINSFGDLDGYPSRQFAKHYHLHDVILTDSLYLKNQLTQRFEIEKLTDNKLRKLYAPVDIGNFKNKDIFENKNSKKIHNKITTVLSPVFFWAGRLDKQKRPDVIVEIAKKRPDWKFKIWGQSVLNDFDHEIITKSHLLNLEYCGVYSNIFELDVSECTAWIYTSEWDGVPNMLLEVASLGLPIVGTNYCGGNEVIDESCAFIVKNINSADEFITQIEILLLDMEKSIDMARNLRNKIIIERSYSKFQYEVNEIYFGIDND
jgi:glycosyltransferase involved in cell wall biosynthesis